MKKITVLAVASLMMLGQAFAQTKKSEKMKQTEQTDRICLKTGWQPKDFSL